MPEENSNTQEPTTPTTPEPKPDQSQDGEPTFTQADVDRIVGERARRASEASVNKLLADLGFEKPEELKNLVTEARKRKEADMSESEKLQAQIAELQQKADDAETRAKQVEAQRLEDRKDAAFKQAAQGANDPDALLLLAKNRDPEAFNAVFSEDGTPDKAKIETYMKELRSQMSYMFQTSGAGSPSNRNGRPVQSDEERLRIFREGSRKIPGF